MDEEVAEAKRKEIKVQHDAICTHCGTQPIEGLLIRLGGVGEDSPVCCQNCVEEQWRGDRLGEIFEKNIVHLVKKVKEVIPVQSVKIDYKVEIQKKTKKVTPGIMFDIDGSLLKNPGESSWPETTQLQLVRIMKGNKIEQDSSNSLKPIFVGMVGAKTGRKTIKNACF